MLNPGSKPMKIRFGPLHFALAGLALAASGLCRAGDGPERGAAVDVSRYPPGIRENYGVFSEKCSRCHKLSRPLNADYVLPDEWAECIRRMKRRSGADINAAEAERLYDFLVYDSSVRKKGKLEAKLRGLTPDLQQRAVEEIKAVAAKYR